ncbi:MAG: helix-turn-helix transcriptional regulator [Clostridia bacterium]|nr:helix-turn-helix transcriptional regulator [Clostridia bacterium]
MKLHEGKYVKTELSCPINVSGIYTVHYFKYGRNFRFPGEKHDFWEMVFIDSGSANIIAGDKCIKLKQGEAYFHKPNEVHNIYTDDEFANSAIISFECKSRALKLLSGKVHTLSEFEKDLLNKIVKEAKISYDYKLNDLYLEKMTKRNNASFGGEQIIKNCIELLIVSILRNMESKDKTDSLGLSVTTDKIVEGVVKVLSDTLEQAKSINLDELSFKLGFSKSYIKAQFKKKTGYSVIQYFITLKIEKAKMLLSQNKYPISEIADLLGFSSVFYFSRQFKIHTDMSPSEYINSIKADNVL